MIKTPATEEKAYTLKQIKEMYFPNTDISLFRPKEDTIYNSNAFKNIVIKIKQKEQEKQKDTN